MDFLVNLHIYSTYPNICTYVHNMYRKKTLLKSIIYSYDMGIIKKLN